MGLRTRFALTAFAAVLSTGLALGLGAAPAHADVDDFAFDSLTVDYFLQQDGEGRARLAVVETWVADFPEEDQNRGILRAIPGRDGYTDLDLTVVDVLDENGDPVFWEWDDDELVIDDDTFKHGLTTYVIRYTMRDVVRPFEAGDEFFPDVNGTGWEQPFGSVTARLHLEEGLAGSLDGRMECFTGGFGSSDQDCEVSRGEGSTADWPAALVGRLPSSPEPTTVITVTSGPLEPEQGLSFDVGFRPETFTQPPTPALVYVSPWIAAGSLLPALGLALASLVSWLREAARRPRPRIVQYTPPRGIGIRLSAVVLRQDRRLLAAAITDLAVRRLVEFTTRGTRTTDAESYTVRWNEGAAPDDADKPLVAALFAKSKSFRLDQFSRKQQRALTDYRSTSLAEAMDAGLVARDVRWLTGPAIAVLVIECVAAVLLFSLTALGFLPPWMLFLALLGVVGLLVLSAVLVPRLILTDTGWELHEYLEGMREYIQLAEADRLRFLQGATTAETRPVAGSGSVQPEPEGEPRQPGEAWRRLHVYERLLPYAVLFGLEKSWAEVLSELGQELPEAVPASDLLVYSVVSSSLFSSSTSSASHYTEPMGGGASGGYSSGFGGGGFSGGGFGGGGGGGR